MQALCHLDVQGDAGLKEVGLFLADADDPQETLVYADRLIRGAWAARAESDALMQQQAHAWDVARMSPVERNVIRVALSELRDDTVPAKIVIDEAIEIAREFSTPEGARFVNGLLDAAWKAWSKTENRKPKSENDRPDSEHLRN